MPKVMNMQPIKALRFAFVRLVASARAGSYFGRLRRRVRFRAVAVDQDGVLLLMPREPSLGFVFVPLAVLFSTAGAVAALI
jgi:hypothetical protein